MQKFSFKQFLIVVPALIVLALVSSVSQAQILGYPQPHVDNSVDELKLHLAQSQIASLPIQISCEQKQDTRAAGTTWTISYGFNPWTKQGAYVQWDNMAWFIPPYSTQTHVSEFFPLAKMPLSVFQVNGAQVHSAFQAGLFSVELVLKLSQPLKKGESIAAFPVKVALNGKDSASTFLMHCYVKTF